MTNKTDYLNINRKSWDARTLVHVHSKFYGMNEVLDGKSTLNDIELQLLGNLKGKSILHLQCHFGLDSISLARLGAQVTGVDFSQKAIEQALELNKKTGQNANFIFSDVYELNLAERFDFIFTTYGVIGWLPDMDRWAKIISKHLKPGGKLIFVEFHPIVWMFDNKFKYIAYNYSKAEEIIEDEKGTYADRNAELNLTTVTWNHSLSEVIGSLIKAGLEIKHFEEYDYSPYNCFEETVEFEKGKFRIKHLGNKIPMIYSLAAEKK